MFKQARIKLTMYYLAIIMAISLFFSVLIYSGLTFELNRIQNRQRVTRPNPAFVIDPDLIIETKNRIFFTLLTLNLFILGVSGVSGYFLAGKTLDPISKMMDEQKEFISNASHELRTPLASIKSEIEVNLRDKKLNLKTAKNLLKSNLDDVNSMTRLTNYLLELNKFQNGSKILKFSNVNLSEVVKIASEKYSSKLDLVDVYVKGNKDALIELARILIDNAHKYGNGKEVLVVLKNKSLKIIDHGMGISSKDLPHIFDRFYRGDKARGKDGYGLGLSIAKQIADIHGAKIKVSSKFGFGSIFKVVFS